MKGGKPYVMFGDGTLAACKPISESDLAAFIADCVQGEDRVNQVLPIGGGSSADCELRTKTEYRHTERRCLSAVLRHLFVPAGRAISRLARRAAWLYCTARTGKGTTS